MKQKLLIISGILIIVLLAVIGIQQYQLRQTKQYSPEATVQYLNNNVRVEIKYNRPFKKGRKIFGELVPYGEWWRTGANEPTTINLSQNLVFDDSDILPAGQYSIVTIPMEHEWRLIFNKSIPDWGTKYNPQENSLEVIMEVSQLPQPVEQFLIDIIDNDGDSELIMAWDNVKASIPFRVL